METLIEKIVGEVIVDLYEIRVSTMHRYQSKYEKIQDYSKYSFFTAAIAQLFDKYKISQEAIDEIIRERAMKEKVEGSV